MLVVLAVLVVLVVVDDRLLYGDETLAIPSISRYNPRLDPGDSTGPIEIGWAGVSTARHDERATVLGTRIFSDDPDCGDALQRQPRPPTYCTVQTLRTGVFLDEDVLVCTCTCSLTGCTCSIKYGKLRRCGAE